MHLDHIPPPSSDINGASPLFLSTKYLLLLLFLLLRFPYITLSLTRDACSFAQGCVGPSTGTWPTYEGGATPMKKTDSPSLSSPQLPMAIS